MIREFLIKLGVIKVCRCDEIDDNIRNFTPKPGEIVNITCPKHGSRLYRGYNDTFRFYEPKGK